MGVLTMAGASVMDSPSTADFTSLVTMDKGHVLFEYTSRPAM